MGFESAAAFMKKALVGAGAVSLGSSFLTLAPASASKVGPSSETIVVRISGGSVQNSSLMRGAVGVSGHRYLIRVNSRDVGAVLANLRAQRGVLSASVPQSVHATVTPDDPCYTIGCTAEDEFDAHMSIAHEQYLNVIGAPQAWAMTHDGVGAKVAVLDSGVDAAHHDLNGKILSQHNICIADDPDCGTPSFPNTDEFGHGTHVTGILAARTNNASGVASLGWNVKVDEYKVLDSSGSGNTADVATAIYDAVHAGDRVINMSLANFACPVDPSDCGPDPDEAAAVEYAIEHSVVVVAAAGNDGLNSPDFPASYPGVLSVAMSNNSGVIDPHSEWGSAANIGAPGVSIVSTWNDGQYKIESGTSMAAPQVAAAAALMIARNPALSGLQVTELLESTARPIRGGHPISGGVLDVPAALAAEAHPPHLFNGYELTGSDGSVYTFGSTGFFGDLSGHPLAKPVVGMALRDDGLGYWMDASDGGVFAFGRAGFYGSTGNIRLAKPVVGMAPTLTGKGYWLVASDGGIFAFGDAGFHGSTGNIRLAKPVVGMAATPDGKGYWMVASDGGIFAFGDAGFYGSTGNVRLARPVVGMTATPDGKGYWLVASDGGIFAFGDAGFHGSTGNVRLAKPVVAAMSTPSGRGYWLVGSDGGVFAFGDSRFWGSTGGEPIPAPIVGAAS